MKFLVQLILIALSTYLAELVFPWWTAALCAFVIAALIPSGGPKAFLSGFLGVGLLWLGAALFFSIRTDYILTDRVADLMQMGSPFILILLTALIGALSGGLGALSGSQLRKLLRQKRKTSSRYHSSF
ncbi:hypothetical protein [Nafulsella turpanensis]|uniref:hypothetical protein n=1 Tax=Nafulsella turpanensis TaxID=1265690 RepID=UPI000347630E|nr:hypothetical protein [Nafulsella turpanensis]